MILAFIFGVLLGNATKARLYAAVCDKFIKTILSREKHFGRLIRSKNNTIKKLECKIDSSAT